jgi:hypothetical protein
MNADFKNLPGIFSSAPRWDKGSGTGFTFGTNFRIPFSNNFALSINPSYYIFNGTLVTEEPQIVSISGEPENVLFKHSIDAKLSSIGSDVLFGYQVFDNLWLNIGSRISYFVNMKFEQKEEIISQNPDIVYLENLSKVRNYYPLQDLPNPSKLNIGVVGGIEYDVFLNNSHTVSLSPSILFDYGISNLVKEVKWKVSSLRGGITFAYSFAPSNETKPIDKFKPIEEEETPPKTIATKTKQEEVKKTEEKSRIEEFTPPKEKETTYTKSEESSKQDIDQTIKKETPITESKPVVNKIQTQDSTSLLTAGDMKYIGKKLQTGIFYRNSLTIVPLVTKKVNKYYDDILIGTRSLVIPERFDKNNISEKSISQFINKFQNIKFDTAKVDSKENIAAIANLLGSSGITGEIIYSTANIDSLKARKVRMKKREVVDAAAAANIETVELDEIKAYINNTFIGVPVLTKIEKDGEKTNALGYYFWYRVVLSDQLEWDGDYPALRSVNLMPLRIQKIKVSVDKVKDDNKKKTPNDYTRSLLSSFGDEFTQESEEEKQMPVENRVTRKFARNIMNDALMLDEFKIRGIAQAYDGGLQFDVGKREGVYLDQGFKIYELRLNDSGEKSTKYLGFTRIDKVADNYKDISQLSSSYTIIPGNFDRGVIAVSHDQFLDAQLKISYNMPNIPASSVNWFTVKYLGLGDDAKLLSADAKSSFNINLQLMYNIAKLTKINQLFVGLDVGFGILGTTASPGISSGGQNNLSINPPFTTEISLLAHKKFWFAPFAAFAELEFGINSLSITGKLNDKDWSLNYGFFNFAAGGNVGLNYPINPDINLGFEIGYRYSLPISEVVLKDTYGKETTYPKMTNEEFWSLFQLDKIQLGGLKFGVNVSYSVPPIFNGLFDWF